MAKFRFAMEPVLMYRQKLEEQAQMEVAKVVQVIAKLEDNLERAQAEESQLRKSRADRFAQGAMSMDYGQGDYQNYLREYQFSMKQQLQQCKQLLEKKRKELLKKAQEKKALEILRDKQKDEFRKEQLHKEVKFLDDLSGISNHYRAEE
jgi:flagellar protein FliJ